MKEPGKKLIVMIPCYNEEKTLPLVVKTIPKRIPGIQKVEVLVVDDGSTDRTYEVARRLGVDHITRNSGNKGLARAFATGIEAALKNEADIIVNTDGDNQYPQQDIPRLIKPILDGEAEIVIADRQTSTIDDFSTTKKFLQRLGSRVVSWVSGVEIPDASSGFRAFSRNAAMQMNIVTDFSYVIETIIQAGKKKIPIASIPIKTNAKTRESRLYGNIWSHVKKSAGTIVRVFAMYEPLKVFSYIGGVIFLSGAALVARFLYYFFIGTGSGHIQSLVFAAILVLIGFQIGVIGLVADLIASNRKFLEEILLRNKKNEWEKTKWEIVFLGNGK